MTTDTSRWSLQLEAAEAALTLEQIAEAFTVEQVSDILEIPVTVLRAVSLPSTFRSEPYARILVELPTGGCVVRDVSSYAARQILCFSKFKMLPCRLVLRETETNSGLTVYQWEKTAND